MHSELATIPFYLYIQYRTLPYSTSSLQIFVIKVTLDTESSSLVRSYQVHISANWSQCKKTPSFSCNNCHSITSKITVLNWSARKERNPWEFRILTSSTNWDWPFSGHPWPALAGLLRDGSTFLCRPALARSALLCLTESRIHVWGPTTFCLLLGSPLARSNDLFFPALVET